jgi:hypothetical protein
LLRLHTEELKEDTQKFSQELLVVLKAHAKAIKLYSLKKYECFEEVIKLMKFLVNLTQGWNPNKLPSDEDLKTISEYLLTIGKIVYRALSLEDSDNASAFANQGGFDYLRQLLSNIVRKFNVAESMKTYDYFNDYKLSFEDLKFVDILIRSLSMVFKKVPQILELVSLEEKLSLFLNIQLVSKIPLIQFENIKNFKPSDEIEVADEDFDFDNSIDKHHPALVNIFEVISNEPNSSFSDTYILKIFELLKHLIDLFTKLSLDVSSIVLLIQSGIAWRILEFVLYYESREIYSEKADDLNYQTMLECIEKLGFILRNVLIYSNEVYTVKMTTAPGSRVGILTSKERSPQLLMSINKLEAPDRNTIAKFHECILSIVGKRMSQVLLNDYYEPLSKPEERDLHSVIKFLNYFSTSVSDSSTLWNEETRSELQALLKSQIISLINSGCRYFDLSQFN